MNVKGQSMNIILYAVSRINSIFTGALKRSPLQYIACRKKWLQSILMRLSFFKYIEAVKNHLI